MPWLQQRACLSGPPCDPLCLPHQRHTRGVGIQRLALLALELALLVTVLVLALVLLLWVVVSRDTVGQAVWARAGPPPCHLLLLWACHRLHPQW